MSKESCSKKRECLHSGDDCLEEGAVGREFGCFEDAGPQCATIECSDHIDSPTIGNCCRFFGEDSPPFYEACENFTAEEPAEEIVPFVSTDTSAPFIRQLPVGLNDEELAVRGNEMARVVGLWTNAQLDLKAYTKSMKKIIDQHQETILEIAGEIRSGSEDRDVQVYWAFDPAHCLKKLFRCDTGAEVETAPMTADELQKDFNFQMEQSVNNVGQCLPGVEEPAEGTDALPAEENPATEEPALSKEDYKRLCCMPEDRDVDLSGDVRTIYCRVCKLVIKKQDVSDPNAPKMMTFAIGERFSRE